LVSHLKTPAHQYGFGVMMVNTWSNTL